MVGPERVRRHLLRRAQSAPLCGVSRGTRAYRDRVPIKSLGRGGRGHETLQLRYRLKFRLILLAMPRQASEHPVGCR